MRKQKLTEIKKLGRMGIMPETCNEKRCCTLFQRNRPGFLCTTGKELRIVWLTPCVCGEFSSETEQLLCCDLQKVSPCTQQVQNSKRKGKRAGRKGRKATEESK